MSEETPTAEDRFEVAPAPRWVTGLEHVPPSDVDATDDPQQFLLIDRQLLPAKNSSYLRQIQRLNNAQAVQALSQVSLDFDPGIESMTVHSIRVWRDGVATERADAAAFKIIQRETNLDMQLYDGRMSALLLLEDIRVGDLLDISATRRTLHPQLVDHFHAAYPTRAPVPVTSLRISAILRQSDGLRWQRGEDIPEATVKPLKGGWELHRWNFSSPPKLDLEPNTPGWHQPAPILECSTFEDWAAVAHWITGIWGTPQVPDELRDLADEIATATDDEVQRADRAIAFVRDEIRYLGLEDGLGSLEPCAPADVMRRRFGDCKDKSRVLCMLLRLLEIPASPVLVNTAATRAVEDMLPAPSAFDHVIVGAKIGGAMRWIDPTRRSLAPTVTELPPPNFARGLLVTAKAKGLVTIPAPPQDAALLVVKENYTLKHPERPAALSITTTGSGFEAEHLREVIGQLGMARYRELRESQLREIHPKLKATSDWTSTEIEGADRYQLEEHFEIAGFALKGDEGEAGAPFGASTLRYRFPGAPEEDRIAPWALPFPCRIRHEVHMDLPFQLPAQSNEDEVLSETFGFRSKIGVTKNKLEAVYRYWSKADHVALAQLKSFSNDVEAMSKLSQQVLHFPLSKDTWRDPTKEPPPEYAASPDPGKPQRKVRDSDRKRKHTAILAGTLVVIVCVGMAIGILRGDRKPKPRTSPSPTPASLAPDNGDDAGYTPLFGGSDSLTSKVDELNAARGVKSDVEPSTPTAGETGAFEGSLLDSGGGAMSEDSDNGLGGRAIDLSIGL